MTPSEIVKLQALKLKATIDGHHPQIVDSLLNSPANQEEVKKDFRNVCALITQGQFEALESLCSLLDLSKREVINMALSEFIPMANAIISEVNPFESQDAVEAQQESK